MPRITQAQFADFCGVSQPTVSRLVQSSIVDLKSGDMSSAVSSYIAHLQEVAAGRSAVDGEFDLVAERARLAHHQANLARLTERQARGELVSSQYHIGAVHLLGSGLNSRLGALHHRVISMVPGLPREAVEELRKGIRTAREELAYAVLDELQKYEENQNARD